MKRYKLYYLPPFSENLNGIVHYISVVLRSPTVTRRLVDDVETVTQGRLNIAESFAPSPSTRVREHPYHPTYVCNFIVFYMVLGGTMEVRRTLYSHRNISAIPQRRGFTRYLPVRFWGS